MMTMISSDVDAFELIELETAEPPKCEHFEHPKGEHPERHDKGQARFEVLLPCGRGYKVCAQFVAWLEAGGTLECTRRRAERHDKHSILWMPL